MALQVLEHLKSGDISVDEILCFLKSDDASKLCQKLNCADISTTDFVCEFLAFLRQQSRTALASAPNSVPPAPAPTEVS